MKTAVLLLAAACCCGVVEGFVPLGLGATAAGQRSSSTVVIKAAQNEDNSGSKKISCDALSQLIFKGGLLASAILGGNSIAGSGMIGVAPAQAAVVNLPRCEGGLGEGCEAMGASNEFVRKLQERSAKNYDAQRKQRLINYNYNNFKDYFAFKGQVLVIRPDGRFIAIEKKLYDQLSKEGKVDGKNWLSSEDPPTTGAVDFLPSSTENVPMPTVQ